MGYTLCLSGGGFRATLFHLGVIRQLIYLDVFNQIESIESVSGGSIAAAMIMKELTNSPFSDVEDFDNRIIKPVINFIQKSPRLKLYKIIPLRKNPLKFARYLDKELFHNLSFAHLIKSPNWVCYATSLNSAFSWKFSQNEIGDSSIGYTQPAFYDRISLGVTASACFPPFFKPLKFPTNNRNFKFEKLGGELLDAYNPTPPKIVFLTDGGVYDNLGIGSILKKESAFIVSDASGITSNWRHETPGLLTEIERPVDITMNQNGKLRRRLLYEKLKIRKDSILIEAGKTISTYSKKVLQDIKSPTLPEDMPKYDEIPHDLEVAIGQIRTDLNAFHDIEIQLLLWNGMVKIDSSIKRWVPSLVAQKHWEMVPKLNINIEQALGILVKSKRRKIWGELHSSLHFDPADKLVDKITSVLQGI